MGRSQGRKIAQALIGDGSQISFQPRRQAYEIIQGALKDQIIQLTKSATSRQELYQPIIEELRKLNPAEMKKDPVFQRIIDFEAKIIQDESEIDIKSYLFDNLTELFFNDLKNHSTPNLARALIVDEKTPKLFKDDLVSHYLGNLYNSEDNYLDFATESLLPLIAEDSYLKGTVINNFSKETVVRFIKESVLNDAFPRIKALNQRGDLQIERSRASHKLYQYLDKEFSEKTTAEDLLKQMAKGQEDLLTEHIFSELIKEKGPLKSNKIFNHNTNRQDKINYLNSVIKKGGEGFDKEVLKKIYLYFGGDNKTWENNYDSFKHVPSLGGEDILNFIEEFNQDGAVCPLKHPGQRYNFPVNWVNKITFGKAFNTPV